MEATLNLLALPIELRLEIYSHLLPEAVMHSVATRYFDHTSMGSSVGAAAPLLCQAEDYVRSGARINFPSTSVYLYGSSS
jgi:hypothetical protein